MDKPSRANQPWETRGQKRNDKLNKAGEPTEMFGASWTESAAESPTATAVLMA